MTPFEEELKRALARREPHADFTRRVLERVEREDRQKGKHGFLARFLASFLALRPWRLAAAATVLLAAGGSVAYQQHERAVRGEAAKRKLLMAVRIAGTELQHVHRHLLEVEATEVTQ
jgi:hypothetical protein